MSRILLITAVLFASQVSLAQSTFGEAMDMGAKKVTKEEWLAMLPVTITGISSSGRLDLNLTFKADGTFSGNVTSREGHGSSGSYGTWTMNDNGERCLDETLSSWNMKYKGCNFTFKVGDKYFAVPSGIETDRDTKIRLQTYTSVR